MADTYTLISSVTVGAGGASSIDFTSIPSTYTDLLVKLSVRTDRASQQQDNIKVLFNSNTTGYSHKLLYVNAGTVSNDSGTSDGGFLYAYGTAASATANTFGTCEFYVPNYAGSNNKSISSESANESNNNTAVVQLAMVADLWANTSAITSISMSSVNSATIQQYSTAYLYGIKNS